MHQAVQPYRDPLRPAEGAGGWSDWSPSAIAAGFLAVLVSFSGPLAIFIQAAQAGRVPDAMFASWVWGISIGAGVAGIVLSWTLRAPVITAWSAPGTALLITLFPRLPLAEAVGAYLTAAVILLGIGLSGSLERIMVRVPSGVASGMMAGILLPFGMGAFKTAGAQPLLAFGMIAAYLLFRRTVPRYGVVLLLAVGTGIAWLTGTTHLSAVDRRAVRGAAASADRVRGRVGAAGRDRHEPRRRDGGGRPSRSIRDHLPRHRVGDDLPRPRRRILGHRHRDGRVPSSARPLPGQARHLAVATIHNNVKHQETIACGISTSTSWRTTPDSTASTPASSRGAPSSSSATATTSPWPASHCLRSCMTWA
jgi:hypothetical protein